MRCYNCYRFGHISKDCPLRRTVVKQMASKPSEMGQRRDTDVVTQIVEKARSLCVRAVEPSEVPLVGNVVPVRAPRYDSTLKKLKNDLEEEEKKKKQIKQGPTAFAASASAALLEKDGPKRGKRREL
uniref:CCHC-type domain-containing protein n=1 Tax=Haemonchus contortus TaxID=6289 RepID=A0A7I4YYI0_HAECO